MPKRLELNGPSASQISNVTIKRDCFQGLEDAGQYVDHLYIQFYNNYCHTGAGKWFTDTLNKWLAFSARMKPSGPLIFIGMPPREKPWERG